MYKFLNIMLKNKKCTKLNNFVKQTKLNKKNKTKTKE